ncbi:MAG TPA: choice-of-anchor D domain-containing protein, partial [Terracidiphilus sp.]|nr:choice-of-anchor D domain-containing protein [Terracidiphilus sp.]
GAGGNVTLGGGGNVTLGAGGENTAELDYNTANSVVRPPSSPTYTVTPAGVSTPESVQVNWMAPAFGVVQTYTISRSVNGGTAVVIGSVSGVNGYPPATTFTDTNPPGGTLVYTIATTLVPDTTGSTPRQSAPSPPAVLTVNQTIVLGPLPSSVVLGSTQPLVVTATAESNSSPNGQLVSFSASGPCSAGSSAINTATGVSSTTVTLTSTGSCTITASQAGDSTTATAGTEVYNAASSASGTFTILPQGSTLQSQTITFGPLPGVQYGSGFTVSASSSASLPVSFTASGPCAVSAATGTASGTTSGAGLCKITASAPANSAYSAAAVTQSFAISAAPLTVMAANVATEFGQPLPVLTPILGTTYSLSGFVNGDSASVVTGAPALSTTAITGSIAGTYPITVSTGSLAAANYSFLFVNGTLTITSAATTTSLVSSTGGKSNYGQLVTLTPTVSGTPAPPGTDSVLYSYTNSSINGGVAVSLGTVPLSEGYSTFLLPPGTNTITATFNGNNSDGNFQSSSASVTQVVASVPVAYISPSSVTFPNTDVGSTSASIAVILTNIGTAPLNISGAQIVLGSAGTPDFIIQSSTCGSSLAPGPPPPGPLFVAWGNAAPAAAPPVPPAPGSTVAVDNSCTVTLAFAPQPSQYVGPRTGTLVFSDNDGGQTGASDYIGLTGSALSAIGAQFPMLPAQTIAAGDYIWFNGELSVRGPLDVTGNPLNMNTDEVQIMVTDGSISFTNPATGTTATIPVPDALIQFVPGLTQASTTFDAANNRWVTQVPMADPATGRSQFVIPGNIFMTGVPYLVPAKITGALPAWAHAQNVTWSAEFTTDTPGVSLSWQWGAAVYNSCFGNQPTSANPTCAGDSLNLANLGVLGVNSADPGKAPYAWTNDYDAGTPYSFINDVVPSAPKGGPPNLYTGNATPMAGVVPAVTPVSFSPSPLVFMPVNAGQSSGPMAITITNTNETLPFNISGVTLTGSNPKDFAITGTTCTNANGPTSVSANSTGALTLAPVSGGSASSCTLTIVFTPGDLGTRTSSLMFTYATPSGMAPNETPPPQEVDLYGTGAGGSNPIVGFSAVSLSFPHQVQGTTSASQTVTLVNAGGGALTINSIAPSGEYGETSTCPTYPSTLPSGGSCTISVWFQPLATAIGAQTGAITITDNNNGVSGSSQTISLSGEASP